MSKLRPRFVAPMLARSTDHLPSGDDWLYELKLDGIRAIVVKDGPAVRLFSRTPREITAEFSTLAEALAQLPVKRVVVDGEIVALDAQGRSSFQLLQNLRRDGTPVLYFLFDVLHVDGIDVTAQPLESRRKLLVKILPRPKPRLRLSPVLEGDPKRIWAEVQRLGFEGVIAKRRRSQYESARRSGAWRKIKTRRDQEFVIGGYTERSGTRQCFGAILVGYYAKGKLMFAAGVGTGFDTETLRSLHRLFQKHRSAKCPFANLPQSRGRWGGRLTAAGMKRCNWLEPRLVCQVKFYEWTSEGNLRHPVFLGLRTDKQPKRVVREA